MGRRSASPGPSGATSVLGATCGSSGEALRRRARELIDAIPAIDLPSAIAFLEFLHERGSEALSAESASTAEDKRRRVAG